MSPTAYDKEMLAKVPAELLADAYKIALWFAERGIKEWELGPIQKRRATHPLDTVVRVGGGGPRLEDPARLEDPK